MLIFIGFFCCFSSGSSRSLKQYVSALPIFFSCCLIALAINWAAGPETNIAMFYISPYHPSQQAVFHRISLKIGIFGGNLLYVASAALGAFLIHLGLRRLKA